MVRLNLPVGLDGGRREIDSSLGLVEKLCSLIAHLFSSKKDIEKEPMHFVDVEQKLPDSIDDVLIDLAKLQLPKDEFQQIVAQCMHEEPFAKHVRMPAESGRYKFVVAGSDVDNTIHLIADTQDRCEFVLLENKLYFSKEVSESGTRNENPFVYGGGKIDIDHMKKTVCFSGFSADYGVASPALVQWLMSVFQEKGWMVYFQEYGFPQK